jgi:hypothetical protein
MRRHIYTPSNCVTEPLPLAPDGVYFIERCDDRNEIVDIPTNKKIAELLMSPITNYETAATYLKLLTRLAKHGCKRLVYKDMEFVAETIKESERYKSGIHSKQTS